LIEIKNLTRRFNNLIAVDNITLSIPAGQICGYLGPNGAGKTTTVKMLTGIIQPTAGTASISGYDIRNESMEVKRRIGYVPESGAVYQSLTPFEYLQFVCRLYKLDDNEIKRKINESLEYFKLKDSIHTRMTDFSKGMKQKVVIASALIHNPQIIFFDEPMNGLDANTALFLKEVIRNLAKTGKTIFYCSHILEVVENLCERIIIIDNGSIIADGSIQELKQMTTKSSLEGIFGKLTQTDDLGELAKVFSNSISKG
jgi:ABC-2 type transport system ATP-binding protein